MEFSQIFGFLKIYSESIKLIFKNVKLIASITTLSLLLSSILLLLFSFFYQSAMACATNSTSAMSLLKIILFTAFIFAVYFTFLLTYIAITHASGIATVIATATLYAKGSKLSLQELFASFKTKWRTPFRKKFRKPQNRMHIVFLITGAVAVVEVMYNPNPFTVAGAAITGFAFFVFHLYASVVWTLAAVIPVVEDGCGAVEAVERAERLVEGQRLDGFMANVFLYIVCVCLIVLLSWRMIVDNHGSLDLTAYGLLLVNSVSLTRIFASVLYTVYYFRCREYHGEEIQPPGDFLHTPLINDVP